ncbi:PilZ domain-containing protein [Ureibacillus endophyticus]|uniref:PilZ domain-containing protein n=1 Tax=Ureibacillus endophyticus TaxID=1978490 RepID=A0A494YSC4_9BACL|nr:PilZ domain-containing protein [Lysinibacillus endophyticus]
MFDPPIEGEYEIYLNGQLASHERYIGQILDISPRGMKIVCGPEIESFLMKSSLQMNVRFLLDVTYIRALGDVIWSRSFGDSFQCGLNFTVQKDIDELITNELKHRRRKEVLAKRINHNIS